MIWSCQRTSGYKTSGSDQITLGFLHAYLLAGIRHETPAFLMIDQEMNPCSDIDQSVMDPFSYTCCTAAKLI